MSAPDAAPPAGAPGAPGAPGADGAPAGAPPGPPNTSSNRRLQQTQAQVEEVVDIMRVNVDKVLERDQKLSELDDRADALQAGASQFESCAAKLKNKYWWKNCKMMIMMGIIGVIVVGIIFLYFFHWAQLISTDEYGLEDNMRGERQKKKPKRCSSILSVLSLLSSHSLPSNHLALKHYISVYRCLCSLRPLSLPFLAAFFHCFDLNSCSLSAASAPHVLLKDTAGRVKRGRKEEKERR